MGNKMSIFDKYDLVEVNEDVLIPKKPKEGITIVVGASGTGKSTILNSWGMKRPIICTKTPIYKLFDSDIIAEKFLISAGLRSIPCWKRPLSEVSNGERHRAEVAIMLSRGDLFIDEFTSLVDRDTARALCCSINKMNLNLTIATCHSDVLKWLDYDSAYSTDSCTWIERGLHRHDRQFNITITPCDTKKVWDIFKKYHYLSGKINKSANSWVVTYNNRVVAMTSVIAFPSGNWVNGWRGHRTVVLPEFQGIGIGNAISDSVAEHITSTGGRFFSKTSHPAMGLHREKSSKWKATTKNKVVRMDYKTDRKTKEDGHKMKHAHRCCFSHEYIGLINE
jgi:ABC-type cobalamin/Fe3+-siderophores transport system ATPase subunit